MSPQRDHKDVASEAAKWLQAIEIITKEYPNKDAEITAADVVWANGVLEFHCEQSHAGQGASPSRHDTSCETYFGTSDSEDGVVLGGTVKLHDVL